MFNYKVGDIIDREVLSTDPRFSFGWIKDPRGVKVLEVTDTTITVGPPFSFEEQKRIMQLGASMVGDSINTDSIPADTLRWTYFRETGEETEPHGFSTKTRLIKTN